MKVRSKISAIFLVVLCTDLFFSIALAEGWSLYKNSKSDNIKISYRKVPSQQLMVEFKGETKVRAKLSSLVSVIRDWKAMNQWVYKVKKAEILELVSDTERYTYIIHKSPLWGFDERDSIVHSFVKQDPRTLEVVFHGEAAPNKKKIDDRYERIVSGKSTWRFFPSENDDVKVTFQGFANPGGNFARIAKPYLVKMFLWKLPYVSLKNLKSQVMKPKYQYSKFSFIMDKKP